MTDPRFPVLNTRQVKILKTYGEIEQFEERTLVFKLGQLTYDFFVILEGAVRIEDPYNNDDLIVEHKKFEFTGDSGMLSNRGAQFNAFTTPNTTLLRIVPKSLKVAIAKHSDISDLLLNAFLLRQKTVLKDYQGGIQLIGSSESKETYTIRDFLEKNHIWYNFVDVESTEKTQHLLEDFDLTKEDLPILVNNDAKVCRNPSLEELARYSGVLMDFEDKVFDLLVIGAGPSGLAASVYAASEGLSVVTIDSKAPGGQAGKSSKIENYLGFPTGISGTDLAQRAYVQAQKFGCNISIPHKAQSLEHDGAHFTLCATNGKVIKTKAMIAATGAAYRQLPIPDIEKYEGSGVYYSATGMNAQSCTNEVVGVVGGGNSAGQAAMFLADHAAEVHVIIRGDDIGAKMSNYLVQRLEASEKIKIHTNTEVTQLMGNHHLEKIVLTTKDGQETAMEMSNLFTFIGAKPATDWLSDLIKMDENGFVCTGLSIQDEELADCPIYAKRKPQSLETSIPGLFAVGDVRNGSVKRVASAVGEGSMAVSQVHYFLAELEV